MSDVARYVAAGYGMVMTDPAGPLVEYADYARLRASSFVTAVPVEEYEKLKAEVERLRKAGDSLVYSLQWCDWGSHIQTMDAVNRWNAAKEGKR